MPYLASVFRNRPIARERADSRQIEDSLARPHFRMLVLSQYLGLDIHIRSKISHQEIVIAADQHVANPSEESRLGGTKSIGRQLIEHPLESRVGLVIFARPIRVVQSEFLDL